MKNLDNIENSLVAARNQYGRGYTRELRKTINTIGTQDLSHVFHVTRLRTEANNVSLLPGDSQGDRLAGVRRDLNGDVTVWQTLDTKRKSRYVSYQKKQDGSERVYLGIAQKAKDGGFMQPRGSFVLTVFPALEARRGEMVVEADFIRSTEDGILQPIMETSSGVLQPSPFVDVRPYIDEKGRMRKRGQKQENKLRKS